MLSKKSVFTGLIMAAMGLPILTEAATLDVYNSTNEDSTVRIVQSGLCSGRGHMTPAHGSSHTSKFKVKMLCLLAKNCSAVMYPSDNCSGDPVAHLSMDTDTLVATVSSMDDSHYTVVANGNRVDIGYAS